MARTPLCPVLAGGRQRLNSVGNSHLSIFTATFMEDCEWLRPWAVASTTRPKAPDPSVRPAEKHQREAVGNPRGRHTGEGGARKAAAWKRHVPYRTDRPSHSRPLGNDGGRELWCLYKGRFPPVWNERAASHGMNNRENPASRSRRDAGLPALAARGQAAWQRPGLCLEVAALGSPQLSGPKPLDPASCLPQPGRTRPPRLSPQDVLDVYLVMLRPSSSPWKTAELFYCMH